MSSMRKMKMVTTQVQVDTIHHEAVTQQVWVVDQQAWTETVASGC